MSYQLLLVNYPGCVKQRRCRLLSVSYRVDSDQIREGRWEGEIYHQGLVQGQTKLSEAPRKIYRMMPVFDKAQRQERDLYAHLAQAHAFWSTAGFPLFGFVYKSYFLLLSPPPSQGFWLLLSSLDPQACLAFVRSLELGGDRC